MNIFIITVVTLSLVTAISIVAYLHRSKEYDRLFDQYSEAQKKYCKTENENSILRLDKREMSCRLAELRSMLFRQKSYRFVLLSENLTNYLDTTVKQFEKEGYQYDKEGSFPTVLCFSKRIETEESNPKDEQRKEGLPDWMYDDNNEPDKLTKAKNEEKERITMEIMECNGDKLRAAKHLGYDINTFLQKMVEYNIH